MTYNVFGGTLNLALSICPFDTEENVQQQQMHRMTVVYNEDVLSYATVKHWAAHFYQGSK